MKTLILAIILAESAFNPSAYNEEGRAVGLMQLTAVGAQEAAKQCDLREIPNLWDPMTNFLYGTCLLNFYLGEAGSVEGALHMYHGGYLQFNLWKNGLPVGPKTKAYVNRVLKNMEGIKNEKIIISSYCNKYPSLPPILCRV